MKAESARTHTYTRDRGTGQERNQLYPPAKCHAQSCIHSVERKRKREIKAPAPFMCPSPSIEPVSQVTFISSPSSNSVHNLVIAIIDNSKKQSTHHAHAHTLDI